MNNFQVTYNNGAVHKCVPEWSWSFGPMADYDLWVVLDGVGTITVNETIHHLSSGSALFLMPGCKGLATHDPENPLTVAAIHLDYYGPAFADKNYLCQNVEQVGFIGELMRHAIIAGMNQRRDEADFWLTAALHKVLPQDNQSSHLRYAAELEQLCAKIINHPEKTYKVSEMASAICLCKDHFTRIFKSLKGLSPRDFIIMARIERARSLLLNSDLTASEIADQLGYSSVNFFSRQFKIQTGQSPLKFRIRAGL